MYNKPNTRISTRFAKLKSENRCGLITFITAGDPDIKTSSEILKGLPTAGADLIEIGMPFSDPMADGPIIQASSLRALKNGMNLKKTIKMVQEFRSAEKETPIILMGYFNPIYAYGVEKFLYDTKQAGVDGLIIVDLPPEEEEELCIPSLNGGLNFIYLTAPTTTNSRLPRVLENASGFIYHVSITGITGTSAAATANVKADVERIRSKTELPIAVGFGIRTPKQASEIANIADAAVVGSVLIEEIRLHLKKNNQASAGLSKKVLRLVKKLAQGVKESKK